MEIFKRELVTVLLGDEDEFRFETRTGLISVSTLTFAPSSFTKRSAGVRGRAIKKDGSLALIQRNDSIPFSEIPPHILRAVVTTFNKNEKVSL